MAVTDLFEPLFRTAAQLNGFSCLFFVIIHDVPLFH
jgi:hypothetical protein